MDDWVDKPFVMAKIGAALERSRRRKTADGAGSAIESAVSDASQPEQTGVRAASDVIDPSALDGLRAMLGAQASHMLPTLLNNFHQTTQRSIDEARQALADSKLDALQRIAHNIKSNATSFGATALAAVARRLEKIANTDLDAGLELVNELQVEYDRAKLALACM